MKPDRSGVASLTPFPPLRRLLAGLFLRLRFAFFPLGLFFRRFPGGLCLFWFGPARKGCRRAGAFRALDDNQFLFLRFDDLLAIRTGVFFFLEGGGLVFVPESLFVKRPSFLPS